MTVQQLIAHVEKSLELAKQKKSKCDVETLQIKGFSTHTMRHFFNNLCSGPVKTYLECGAFFGASACAAMCGNKQLTSYIIEDFSQNFSEEGARDSLLASLQAVKSKTGNLVFIEKNCYEVPVRETFSVPVNAMFFDAEHSFPSKAKALPYVFAALSDVSLFIVDDWAWPDPSKATRGSFSLMKDRVKVEREWILSDGGPDGPVWHNDLAVFILRKL